MWKYKYVVIEGNIGVGKSTLANFLVQQFDASLLLEEFEMNKSLQDFYKDNSFALSAEVQFVLDRSRQLHRFHAVERPFIIADYMPSKSMIFAGANLPKSDFAIYQPLAKKLLGQHPNPDLIIYLYRTVDDLLHNIQQRGRAYEQTISPDYLQSIDDAYTRFFKELDIPVLMIDAKHINLKKTELLTMAFQKLFQTPFAPEIRSVELNHFLTHNLI